MHIVWNSQKTTKTLKYLFYFYICVCLHVYVCLHAHVSMGTLRIQKRMPNLEDEAQAALKHLMWVQGTGLGSLQEQQALLIVEPLPQSLVTL